MREPLGGWDEAHWCWLAMGCASRSALCPFCSASHGLHVQLTLALRPLHLCGERTGWEDGLVKAGWQRATRVLC